MNEILSREEYKLIEEGVIHICANCEYCLLPKSIISAKCLMNVSFKTPDYWVTGDENAKNYKHCKDVRVTQVCKNYKEKENEPNERD